MLSRSRTALAQQVGMACAHSMFCMMLNPKFRGKGFQWSHLADMAAGVAETTVGMQGEFGRDQKRMELVAADSARFTVKRCLRDSGVEGWLRLEHADD